jgi:hypothetical protein
MSAPQRFCAKNLRSISAPLVTLYAASTFFSTCWFFLCLVSSIPLAAVIGGAEVLIGRFL